MPEPSPADDCPQDESPHEDPLDRRAGALGKLLEVTRSLAAEIDLDRILTIITQGAATALDCDRASLFQYDPQREEMFTRIVTRLEISEIRKSVDRGITGYVARSGRIANIPDPRQDARWDSTIDQSTGYRTLNILAAPVVSPHDERLLGVLQLLNKHGGTFDRQDEEIVEAFAQHAAAALDRARLVDELREREQVEASLGVARQVQRGFMPEMLPDTPGYEVDTWWFPNEAVGGDYCDVVRLPDDRTALVIADVSGHGLGPSLIMAGVRAALRALVLDESSPAVLLTKLAAALADDFQQGRFITMVLAALDPSTHTLQYANAGHAPALFYSLDRDEFAVLAATGVPLGVLDEPDYSHGETIAISPGDVLVLCTDGIVEAMDHEGRQFGEPRLRQLIRKHCRDTPRQLVQAVGAAVSRHYVGQHPPDDLTILALRRSE